MDDGLDALSAEPTPEPLDESIELLIGVARVLADEAATAPTDTARQVLTFLAADALDAIDDLEAA